MSKKTTIHQLDTLLQDGLIRSDEREKLNDVVDHFTFAISQQLYELIDVTDPTDPIAKQFVPSVQELETASIERDDPIGDAAHETVKGIIHRHRDRCLFLPVQICPVYCRFCFRRETVGESSKTLTRDELEAAFDYIAAHPDIWEVIITGGEPLILKPSRLQNILERLSNIPHVEVLRIHTRVPFVESHRINAQLIDVLRQFKSIPIFMVVHANHPKEFTEAAKKACATLIDAGIPLLSQTTLLKNVNDHIDVLSNLMRCFIKNRIKPYYLHHADLAKGTAHFRTTIEEGQQLMRQLRSRFSGLCQPTYVLDIPGGYGKVPIGPQYFHCVEGVQAYQIEDGNGCVHEYLG